MVVPMWQEKLDVNLAWYYLAAMSFRIEHNHTLGIDEARDRIRALGEYLDNKHGIGVTWTGENEAKVKGSFLVIKIDAMVKVEERRVMFEGIDPGMLWRGKAREYLARKLGFYLDSSRSLADLPRG